MEASNPFLLQHSVVMYHLRRLFSASGFRRFCLLIVMPLGFTGFSSPAIPQTAQPILRFEGTQRSHVYFERGLEKLKFRQYRSAIVAFDQAIQIDPKFTQAYSGRGFAYYQLDNLQQAFASYQAILQIDPNSFSAYSGMALVREKLGDTRQASADALKSAALHSQYTTREQYQGELNMLELSQASAGREPLASWNLMEKGYQKIAAKDYQGAVEQFTQAIGKVPAEDGRPYIDRGIAYYGLGNYQAAIADFTKTLELNPYLLKAWEYRGQTYQRMGNRAAAQADFKKATELARQFKVGEATDSIVSNLKQKQ
jgi:tetratricopeptide (TPR) repeat protein